MKKHFLIPALLFANLFALFAAPVSFLTEMDGRSRKNILTFNTSGNQIKVQNSSPFYYTVHGTQPLTDKWQKYTIEFTPTQEQLILGFRCDSADRLCRMDIDNIILNGKAENIANNSFEKFNTNKEAASWRYYIQEYHFTNARDAFHGKAFMRVSRSYAARMGIQVRPGKVNTLTFMARLAPSAQTVYKKWASSMGHAASGKLPVIPNKNTLRMDVDGFYSEVDITSFSTGKGLSAYRPDWRRGPLGKNSSLVITGKEPVSDKWQQYSFSFTPSRNGEVHMRLSSTRRGPVGKMDCIAYDNIKISGAEKCRNGSFELILGGAFDGWDTVPQNVVANAKDAFHGKNYALAASDCTMRLTFAVFAGKKVTVTFHAKRGPQIAKPESKSPPKVQVHKKDYYMHYEKKACYLPLADKGLKGSDIVPRLTTVKKSATPPPEAEFKLLSGACGKETVRIPVELLEEKGIARNAQIRFGLPLAKGKYFNTSCFRVISPSGKAVPAQFSALSLWQDQSIKSLLVQFTAPMKAKERQLWFVEAGSAEKKSPATPLKYQISSDKITVDTGVLQAEIDRKNFNLLKSVKVNGKYIGGFTGDAITLKLENGKSCTLAVDPARITVAEAGPVRLTILARGALQNDSGRHLDCIARISFYANSSEVNFELRFINKKIDWEFSDFASLKLNFSPAAKAHAVIMNGLAADRIFQHDDRKLQAGYQIFKDRLDGTGELICQDDSVISFDFFKAGLRYPKAFSVNNGKFTFELLPELPDKKFGKDLPFYLMFPFCEGFYRMKWGTGFRENITIDFAGKMKTADMVVPVTDRSYVASTKVYNGISPKEDKTFEKLDQSALQGFYNHMKMKEKQREYGFMNYGDWYGERGRNWTNNEYDFAHGLFMLHLRTGNRDTYRWALIAAAHQADVDIVHAYPDPAFVGVNAPHGIGHTGYGSLSYNTWSSVYDHAYLGTNGHTWSEGMCEAWMLYGDAETMNSALLLGEHLTRYTAPLFRRLTTHERSAGWSNRALIGLYKATGHRKYLDASARIVECVMNEQKPHLGGAWPHRLPSDHGAGKRGTYGNCPYLVGIIMSTLRAHYEFNPSERLKNSLIMAAKWQMRTFRSDFLGWPYGASWDNKGYTAVSTGLNTICTPGIAAAAVLSKDQKMYDLAYVVLVNQILQGFSPIGKTLSIGLCMLPEYLEDMRTFVEQNPKAKKFIYAPELIEQHLANAPIPDYELTIKSKRFRVRGGLHKEFRVTLTGNNAAISVERTIYGSKESGENSFSVKLLAPDGKVIKSYSGNAEMKKSVEKFTLSGKPGDVFKLLIRDDFKGIWHVEADKNCRAASVILPVYTFANDVLSSYNVVIPEKLDQVKLKFSGLNSGVCRIALMNNDGSVEKYVTVSNNKRIQPWETDRTERNSLIIKPQNGKRARRIVISYGRDVLLQSDDKGVTLELAE